MSPSHHRGPEFICVLVLSPTRFREEVSHIPHIRLFLAKEYSTCYFIPLDFSRVATAQQNGSLTVQWYTPDSLSRKWGPGLKLCKLKHTQGACRTEARPEPGSGAANLLPHSSQFWRLGHATDPIMSPWNVITSTEMTCHYVGWSTYKAYKALQISSIILWRKKLLGDREELDLRMAKFRKSNI